MGMGGGPITPGFPSPGAAQMRVSPPFPMTPMGQPVRQGEFEAATSPAFQPPTMVMPGRPGPPPIPAAGMPPRPGGPPPFAQAQAQAQVAVRPLPDAGETSD